MAANFSRPQCVNDAVLGFQYVDCISALHVSFKMGEVGRSHFIPTAYAAQAHPGVCVIIVNQKFPNLPMRDGAKVDFELLASTFGNLGFKVIAMFDATDIDILRILEKGR